MFKEEVYGSKHLKNNYTICKDKIYNDNNIAYDKYTIKCNRCNKKIDAGEIYNNYSPTCINCGGKLYKHNIIRIVLLIILSLLVAFVLIILICVFEGEIGGGGGGKKEKK